MKMCAWRISNMGYDREGIVWGQGIEIEISKIDNADLIHWSNKLFKIYKRFASKMAYEVLIS